MTEMKHVSDGVGRLVLLGGIGLYVGLTVYASVLIWDAAASKVPHLSDPIVGSLAALAAVFAVGFASVLDVTIDAEKVRGLRSFADPRKFFTSVWALLSTEVLLAAGIFLYMLTTASMGVAYIFNSSETPGVVKTIVIAFGGYAIAYIGNQYRTFK